MKMVFCVLLLIIVRGIDVSYNQQCSCSVFTGDTACGEQSLCFWNLTVCDTKSCGNFIVEKECNAQPTCSWNNDRCSTFTTCSDYIVNDSFNCYLLGNDNLLQWCQPTENGNTCTDYQYQSCGVTQDDCYGFKSYWNMCYWLSDSSQCAEIDVRYCDKQVTEELCVIFGEGLGCQWKENACRAYTCADFTTEAQCVLVRQNNIQENPSLCKWSTTYCEDAMDVSHLDFSNCFTNSMNNYIWDTKNEKCVSCQDYQLPSP